MRGVVWLKVVVYPCKYFIHLSYPSLRIVKRCSVFACIPIDCLCLRVSWSIALPSAHLTLLLDHSFWFATLLLLG